MNKSRRSLRWLPILLLALLGRPSAAAGKDLYANPRPFGPDELAFPANCTVSANGTWVAFMEGTKSQISIWNLKDAKQVWSGKYPCGSHRVAFTAGSDRLVAITGEGLLVVQLADGSWRVECVRPLGFKPETSKEKSPSPIVTNHSATGVFFDDAGESYSAGKEKAPKKLREPGEVAYHTLRVNRTNIVTALRKPFVTKIMRPSGEHQIDGIVLAGSGDGACLLVATNSRFDSRSAKLQITDPESGKKVGRFSLSKGAHRPLMEALYSPDSMLLVTVEGKGNITLRDPRKGKPLQKITEYTTGCPTSAAFTPDGKHLITCGVRKGAPGVLLWDRQ